MQKEITNILIDYANEEEVIRYAEQLKNQSVRAKILVVVNRQGEKGIDYLRHELDRLCLESDIVNPQKNLGYMNGLLCGYRADHPHDGWYILSNTDVVIRDPDFIKNFLVSEKANDPAFWLIGPSIHTPAENRYSNPHMRVRPTARYYRSRIAAMRFPHIFNALFRIKSKLNKESKGRKQESREVYAVHGSFMFLRKELLDRLCEEPEWELLYGEEQLIAETVRKNGRKVYYDSEIEVEHNESACTGKMNIESRYALMAKSNRRILRDYY